MSLGCGDLVRETWHGLWHARLLQQRLDPICTRVYDSMFVRRRECCYQEVTSQKIQGLLCGAQHCAGCLTRGSHSQVRGMADNKQRQH